MPSDENGKRKVNGLGVLVETVSATFSLASRGDAVPVGNEKGRTAVESFKKSDAYTKCTIWNTHTPKLLTLYSFLLSMGNGRRTTTAYRGCFLVNF